MNARARRIEARKRRQESLANTSALKSDSSNTRSNKSQSNPDTGTKTHVGTSQKGTTVSKEKKNG